jgi:hypothetical protein
MSRIRNFTSSLDSGNFTAGVTSSLQNLSTSLLNQSREKNRLAQSADAEIENKRRFELQQRNAEDVRTESTRRYNAEQEQSQANRTENARRYDNSQTTAQNALNLKRDNKNAQFDLLQGNYVFTAEDYSPEAYKNITSYKNNLDEDKKSLTAFLQGVTADSDSANDKKLLNDSFKSSTRNLLRIAGDDGQKEKDLLDRRELNLESYLKEFKSKDLSDKDRSNRIQEIVEDQFGYVEREFNRKISTGVGLSSERRLDSALAQLTPEQQNNLQDPQSVAAILSRVVGGRSEADTTSLENQRNDSIFQNRKAESKALVDSTRLAIAEGKRRKSNKEFSSNYEKSPEKTVADLNSKIGLTLAELSEDHSSAINKAIGFLAKEGYTASVIEKAILSQTQKGSWNPADDNTLGSLAEIAKSAKSIQGSGDNYTEAITKEELLAVRPENRSLSQLTLQDLGLTEYSQRPLLTNASFVDSVRADREQTRIDNLPLVEPEVPPVTAPIDLQPQVEDAGVIMRNLFGENRARRIAGSDIMQGVSSVASDVGENTARQFRELADAKEEGGVIGLAGSLMENTLPGKIASGLSNVVGGLRNFVSGTYSKEDEIKDIRDKLSGNMKKTSGRYKYLEERLKVLLQE